ncbi:MAG: gamma-glutamyl-gamma-aminobutyrate hydrolase family protein [Holophagales bacterium]|nr:gamma-glutamyl-gamma-aminobutyrate hydrolase family protein [Holophagales bacterium]
MNQLLMTCRDKQSLLKAYIPAMRFGGWEGSIEILTPGDLLNSWEGVAGLLLAGGDDIHPKNWDTNEPLHPSASVDEERDSLEIPLIQKAWELKLPIFGICRGEQTLNVALGGSLIQDIPEMCGCKVEAHRHGDSQVPDLRHTVRINTGSHLAKILGQSQIYVNSRHHQAIANPAPSLKPVAWHDETQFNGKPLIEAVETIDSSRWVLGVQWHPENLVGLEGDGGRAARNLFRAFVSRLIQA